MTQPIAKCSAATTNQISNYSGNFFTSYISGCARVAALLCLGFICCTTQSLTANEEMQVDFWNYSTSNLYITAQTGGHKPTGDGNPCDTYSPKNMWNCAPGTKEYNPDNVKGLHMFKYERAGYNTRTQHYDLTWFGVIKPGECLRTFIDEVDNKQSGSLVIISLTNEKQSLTQRLCWMSVPEVGGTDWSVTDFVTFEGKKYTVEKKTNGPHAFYTAKVGGEVDYHVGVEDAHYLTACIWDQKKS